MTEIDFCFNVADKMRLVTRYAMKTMRQNQRLLILAADEPLAAQVSQALWSGEQTSFLPHCRAGDPHAAQTPVIVDTVAEPMVHDDILLNLCPACPPVFSRFHRLIELVGHDEADKDQARERFRYYRDRGYLIRRHDMSR